MAQTLDIKPKHNLETGYINLETVSIHTKPDLYDHTHIGHTDPTYPRAPRWLGTMPLIVSFDSELFCLKFGRLIGTSSISSSHSYQHAGIVPHNASGEHWRVAEESW